MSRRRRLVVLTTDDERVRAAVLRLSLPQVDIAKPYGRLSSSSPSASRSPTV